ncbi:MAG: fibro-slime domain-containing protein, partial [Ruminococcus sp.]
MKKIISLILSVTMLASAAQLYASADRTPVPESETTQEITHSSAQTTDESIKTAESENNSTALTESTNETAETENSALSEPAGIASANSPMLTAISGSTPVDLGETFYAKISTALEGVEKELKGYELGLENINDITETSTNPMDILELVIEEPSNDLDHIWKFVRGGESGSYYYNIINMSNNEYLDNPAHAAYPEYENHITNNNVIVYPGGGTGDNEKWQIYQADTDTYYFSPMYDECQTNPVMNVLYGDYNFKNDLNGQVGIWSLSGDLTSNQNERFKINVVPFAPKLDEDADTVTSDAIKFSLFNYNNNINRVGGASGADFRSLAPYFSFIKSGYTGDWPSAYWDGILSNTNNNIFIYDSNIFDVNHATVEKNLDSNGYPVLRLDNKKDSGGNVLTNPLSNSSDRSLAYLFGGEQSNAAVDSYSPTNTFLQEITLDGVKHYYYNSKTGVSGSVTKDNASAVDYDLQTNQFRVRNYTEKISGVSTEDGSEFLPFNTTYDSDNHAIDVNSVDYWFGMRMDVDFIQSANGKIGNEEMVFNFTGDDDIWVFIDGVLVLDMGGIHDAVTGSINFATGEVKTKGTWALDPPSYSTSLKDCFTLANQSGKINENGTFDDYTSHTLSMFYLERGAGASTCCIDFNMPTMPDGSLAVAKDVVSSSNEDLNSKEDTNYTFRLSRDSDSDSITSDEIRDITKLSKDGTTTTFDGDVSSSGYYEFTLKGGERIYFTHLDDVAGVSYKIEEVTAGKDYANYIKTPQISYNGNTTTGYSIQNVKPTETEQTVKFTNTLKSLDVTLKYYGRETENGKPADIKKEPTTYTKSYIGQDYLNYINSTDENIKKDPIGAMILATGVAFDSASAQQDTKYKNVLDGYEMWITQAQAKSNIESKTNLHTNSNYSDGTYHTNWYGYTQTNKEWADTNLDDKSADGEKWVNYYCYTDGKSQEISGISGNDINSETEITNR